MLQPTPTPFIVIGNVDTKYGKFLKEKYAAGEHIRFLGGIYNLEELNNLRYYSNLYFHGHSVGGTNPSLLEAMASQAVICAHDNIFNRSVLENNGFYFSDAGDVMGLLGSVVREKEYRKIAENKAKIIHQYSCETIIDQYLKHFEEITEEKKVVKVFQYSR
jgi:glycosyltransferase involved in cell wall biosynthesis